MSESAPDQATESRNGNADDPAFQIPEIFKRGDIALALGVIAILVVLLLPMPTWLLDFSLAISITFSLVILMTVLFIQNPLELNTFPTLLLIATMLRLALNLASTRLILADGHTGGAAAGQVIQAFGNFVVGGNYVIGIIVFGILVIVNFVVITKGAGRIAEVAARFSLDAMPGKQMAIDADLSSGLIGEEAARKRRSQLEEENSFFGAMDGASKFVRGDAIAGLLITFINIVGGIIIGTAQQNMTLGNAAETYTLLTIGDGLVTQIPALVVSIAAGMLVTRSGVQGAADEAVLNQLTHYPIAMTLATGVLVTIAVLPGMPALPFLIIASITGYNAFALNARNKKEEEDEAKAEEERHTAPPPEEPIGAALQIDNIRLELGYGLLSLINNPSERRLTDQIKALRRQLAGEMGYIMPAVRIQDNLQLPPNNYILRVKEIEAGIGELRPNNLLVMDPKGEQISLPGEATVEPTFGLPAMWFGEQHRNASPPRADANWPWNPAFTYKNKQYIECDLALVDTPSEHKKKFDQVLETHKPALTIIHIGNQRTKPKQYQCGKTQHTVVKSNDRDFTDV